MASVQTYLGCRVCGKPGRLCKGCRSVAYCSLEHQRLDRPQHREQCRWVLDGTSDRLSASNPMAQWLESHVDRFDDMKRAVAAGTLTPNDIIIMLEDRWVPCEADAAAIAVYVDFPAIVAAILEEHKNKPPLANSAIVPHTQDEDGEPTTYYGQFQFGIFEEAASALLGPGCSPTPPWLRPALRAHHAGTPSEADLALLRWAKAKFTTEAAAASESARQQ